MNDPVIWAALAAIGALGVLQLAILKWVGGIARQIALAETKATHADAIAAGSMAKCEMIGTDFHNHRVDTASKVAKIEAMAEGAARAIIDAENRLGKALDGFGDRLDALIDRFDRMLEHQPPLRHDKPTR